MQTKPTPAITIEGFSKAFGSQRAVHGLSFVVESGEIMAFLGQNGSGKTTTIRCLLRIYQPDSGKLAIFGKRYTSELNGLLGYLPEERGIYTKVKVSEIFSYFGDLRGLSRAETQKFSTEYMERVGLIEHRDKRVDQLSSGMQQKAQIGLTIMHRPKLLILDEPFKGLDPLNRQLFTDIFTELNREHGTTILYSTHVVDEAQRIADRVVIINEGQLAAYGTIAAVRSKYGHNTINIEYTNKPPEELKSHSLFSARISHKTAELTPAKGTTTDAILRELTKLDLGLTKFAVDYPSLNEVFLNIAGKTSQ